MMSLMSLTVSFAQLSFTLKLDDFNDSSLLKMESDGEEGKLIPQKNGKIYYSLSSDKIYIITLKDKQERTKTLKINTLNMPKGYRLNLKVTMDCTISKKTNNSILELAYCKKSGEFRVISKT